MNLGRNNEEDQNLTFIGRFLRGVKQKLTNRLRTYKRYFRIIDIGEVERERRYSYHLLSFLLFSLPKRYWPAFEEEFSWFGKIDANYYVGLRRGLTTTIFWYACFQTLFILLFKDSTVALAGFSFAFFVVTAWLGFQILKLNRDRGGMVLPACGNLLIEAFHIFLIVPFIKIGTWFKQITKKGDQA